MRSGPALRRLLLVIAAGSSHSSGVDLYRWKLTRPVGFAVQHDAPFGVLLVTEPASNAFDLLDDVLVASVLRWCCGAAGTLESRATTSRSWPPAVSGISAATHTSRPSCGHTQRTRSSTQVGFEPHFDHSVPATIVMQETDVDGRARPRTVNIQMPPTRSSWLDPSALDASTPTPVVLSRSRPGGRSMTGHRSARDE